MATRYSSAARSNGGTVTTDNHNNDNEWMIMATSFVSSSMAATSTGDSTGGSGGGTSTYQRPSLWASNMSLNARSPPQGSAGADNNANGNGPTPPSRNNIPMSRRITTTNITQRAYLADQKQPFAHLQTKSLLLSVSTKCSANV
jgi:hypothetical protein